MFVQVYKIVEMLPLNSFDRYRLNKHQIIKVQQYFQPFHDLVDDGEISRAIDHQRFFLLASESQDSLEVYLLKKISWKRKTRSEEHTSELQSRGHLVCRLLLEKKKTNKK